MTARELSPVDINLEGIGHILRDRRLEVPAYQRGYSWEDEEFGDFWWDLRAAFGSAKPQYFLGTIVLTRGSAASHSTIIDGQQRLTTTSLLFTALRNEFLRRGDTNRAQVIERDYILTLDLRSNVDVPRLMLNSDDQPSYAEAIFTRPLGATDHGLDAQNESRLIRALLFFENQIRLEAKNAGPHWAEVLFRWVEFLEHGARVINVEVSDEADAFLIFETLNARGRELTVADLLKNYLFGLAGDELPLLQEQWLAALRSLETSADEEVFTTFVRHLWGSLRGSTRERELYARLKAAITAKPAALAFGNELRDASPYYAALLNSDQPFWTERAELKPAAETLLRLGLEQNRPLLLAAMRRFEDEEMAKLIRAVVSWSVRGIVVGGIGGGSTERAYGEAAVAVTEGRAKDTEGVFQELSDVIPTDDTFREAFAVRRISRTRVAKYLLVALSQAEEGSKNPLVVPDSIEAAFQLNALLPRGADASQWPGFAPDEVTQWTLRLGNLYVIESGSSKKGPATKRLNPAKWSPERILARQTALADLAVKVWPRRP